MTASANILSRHSAAALALAAATAPDRVPRRSTALAIGAALLFGALRPVGASGDAVSAIPPAHTADTVIVPAGSASSHIELLDLSPGQRETVDRVIGHYGDAGLELPPLIIRGGEPTDCHDHFGVHRHHAGRSEILLCSEPSPGWDRRVVGHELAHAWVEHHVTEQQREEFRVLRGWVHWRDYEAAAWRNNGTEQAAEIVSWAVHAEPTPLLIDVTSCTELDQAFHVLTGVAAPNGHTRFCDSGTALADARF